MVKYIVSAALLCLLWLAFVIFRWPLTIAVFITLVVGIVLGVMFALQKYRERKQAQELEKALDAQAARQAAAARPDLQAEIQSMNSEFQKAIQALNQSKGGKDTLYTMPWYMIIGPPGCGKSTALRNSGMQFPYLSSSGGGVRGLGGTRNCDWWLTNDGVLLDTAGRWTTEDEDKDEWIGFLDLVKEFRPKKPLNGVIAAVSMGDLGGAGEKEVVALAQRIRERIDEVMGQLKMSLPVYVMFTKCDLMPGFVEMFSDLSREQRAQIWGFTVPLANPPADIGGHFEARFEELVDAVQFRALKRMGEERRILNRELIHGFPEQLAFLKQNMRFFLNQLFMENVYRETPMLRGVYLTSGTQEGRPIDRVMNKMAEAFGINPQTALSDPVVETKSYFLKNAFTNVVFKDGDIAVRSPDELRRQRIQIYTTSAAILGVAVLLSALPAFAWTQNRSYMNRTQELVDHVRDATANIDETPVDPDELSSLRARAHNLDNNRRHGPPFLMGLGMYRGDQLYVPTRDSYLGTVQRAVIAPLFNADLNAMNVYGRQLDAMQTQLPTAEEARDFYGRLKLHLLLTQPRAPREPELLGNDSLKAWVVSQLKERWIAALEIPRHDPRRDAMDPILRDYVNYMARHPEGYAFERSEEAVRFIRAAFERVPPEELATQQLIWTMRNEGYDLALPQLMNRDRVFSYATTPPTAHVRSAFTRRAWDSRVENEINENAARFFGEAWVYGRDPDDYDVPVLVRRLRSNYFRRYSEEWTRFINSIRPRETHNHNEALQVLTELTSDQPAALTRFVSQVQYNTVLYDPREAALQRNREAFQRGGSTAARQFGARFGRSQLGRAAVQVGSAAARDVRRNVEASGGSLDPDNTGEEYDIYRLASDFEGFVAFAVADPTNAASEETTGQEANAQSVTGSRRYEEQLEFLRLGLEPIVQNGENEMRLRDYHTRQERARRVLEEVLGERPDVWRERFQTLLTRPIEGMTPLEAEPSAEEESSAPRRRGRRRRRR